MIGGDMHQIADDTDDCPEEISQPSPDRAFRRLAWRLIIWGIGGAALAATGLWWLQ